MKRSILMICAVAVFALAVPADAGISYTVSGWGPTQFPGPVTPPDGSPWGPSGYPGDTLEMVSYTGTLNLTPGVYELKINDLDWTIDYTYAGTATDPNAWSDLLFDSAAVRGIVFEGGASGSLSQTAQLEVTWENDFLSLDEGATSSFIVGGYRVDVTPLGLAEVGGSNFSGSNPWAQPARDIMARFDVTEVATVPAPGAALLVALGIGVVGWLKRRLA